MDLAVLGRPSGILIVRLSPKSSPPVRGEPVRVTLRSTRRRDWQQFGSAKCAIDSADIPTSAGKGQIMRRSIAR